MLENIKSENAVERRVAKREMVRVAHDIGVPKNLMLELDAIGVALGRSARADMKNEVISIPENLLVLSADRVAGVVCDDQLEWLGQKNGDGVIERERAGTILTSERVVSFTKRTVTERTNQDVLEASA
jgi:hypothetical protein